MVARGDAGMRGYDLWRSQAACRFRNVSPIHCIIPIQKSEESGTTAARKTNPPAMTKEKVYKTVCEYILRINQRGIYNSYLCVAIDPQMGDIDYQWMLSTLKQEGLVVVSGDYITLTDRGLGFLMHIKQVLANANRPQPTTQ